MGDNWDDRLDEEIQAHLAALEEDYRRAGMPPEQARLAARRAFGGVEHIKEHHREQQRFAVLTTLFRDLRYAFRTLARSPIFALAAALIIALGIGSSTTVFSVANAVLFRPLPFPHPDELVSVFEWTPRGNREGVAPATFLDWRAQNRCFTSLATKRALDLNLTGSGEPEQLGGDAISEGMLDMLGGAPILGRTLRAEDFRESAPDVVLLSWSFWQRRFGGRDVTGSILILGGKPYTVIGVMPRSFWFFWGRTDLWLPLRWNARELAGRTGRASLMSIARLRPGTSPAQAQQAMDALQAGITALHPEMNGWRVMVRPLREQPSMVRRARPALMMLLAAVSLVLLIVCANVANLMLLRGTARAREIAVRAALGARRGTLAAQFLVESLMLSLAGGVGGVLLSIAGIRAADGLIPEDLRLSIAAAPEQVGIDSRILWFSFGVSIATGLLFGVAPALRLSRPNIADALKSGGRGAGQHPSVRRFRSLLAVSEIALSGVLLIAAALILQSYVRMYTRDLGYRPRDVQTTLLLSIKSQAADAALREVSAIPGVRSAAFVEPLPGWPVMWPFDFRQVEFADGAAPAGRSLQTMMRGPYLETLGFQLLRGRGFTSEEQAEEHNVAIVNQEFARRYLASEPIGKRFRGTGSPAWLTVIGMVNDERHPLSGEPMPAFYRPGGAGYLMVRAPMDLSAEVRRAIWRVDRNQPVLPLPGMEQLVAEARSPVRFGLVLMGTFSVLALIIATLGLYAVVAYGAASRSHEIGVRIALGATHTDIRRLILGGALRLAAVGIGAAVLGALAASKLLAGMLFGVSATDPATFVAAALLLLLVAMAAAWHPARKAAHTDPMGTLRAE
jgi:putative ABC transport system permease protein